MTETDKVRENKARRWATRLHHTLQRSRAKRLHSNDRGFYQLRDWHKGVELGVNFDATLDEVESYLDEKENGEARYEALKADVYRKAKAAGLWPTWNPGAGWHLKDPGGQTVAQGNMRELNEYLEDQSHDTAA